MMTNCWAGSARAASFLVPVFVLLLSLPASAEIPQTISYQGKVTDTAGSAVADGSCPMQFQIYDAETGGTQLWDSGPQTVTLSGGVFSVMLGTNTMPAMALAFDKDYWPQVFFNYNPQSPRHRLGSMGYAYMASGVVAGTELLGSVSYGAVLTVNNTAPSDPAQGVMGISGSTSGSGVFGFAGATTGQTNGVVGVSYSVTGRGVVGFAPAATDDSYGGYFESSSKTGTGAYGCATATTNVN